MLDVRLPLVVYSRCDELCLPAGRVSSSNKLDCFVKLISSDSRQACPVQLVFRSFWSFFRLLFHESQSERRSLKCGSKFALNNQPIYVHKTRVLTS